VEGEESGVGSKGLKSSMSVSVTQSVYLRSDRVESRARGGNLTGVLFGLSFESLF